MGGVGIFKRAQIVSWAGSLKRSLAAAAVICAVIPLAACNSSSSSGDGNTSGGINAVCTVLQTATMAKVGEDLLKDVSEGSFAGGLAVDLVITEVQSHCQTLLTRAVDAVSSFFGGDPQQTRVAPVANFQSLSSAADGGIASQLDALGYQVSSGSVATLVSELCADVKGGRASSPRQDVQAMLPGAGLRTLPALNGVTAEVTRTCSPINAFESDSLVSDIYQYLLSDERLDAASPVITSFTWSWVGPSEIQVYWSSTASGAGYALWVSDDGQWEQLSIAAGATSAPVSGLSPGHYYEFAVRAFAAGAASPWAYLNPCFSCAP